MDHGARLAEAAAGAGVNAKTWARAKALFQQALEQPSAERRAWLARAAGDDLEIAKLVQTLVESSETLDGFLEAPVVVPPEDLAAVAAGAGWLQPGMRVGPYEITREIGRGGMGVVYLARDNIGRDVALKALPPETAADPVTRARLKREAQAAATIKHPGVATVFAFDELEGQPFIVSEYVDGRSLRDAIAAGPLPKARAVILGIEIADALHAAHAAGVIHRDLKPDNVLLTTSGAVKLVDFGIAHVASDDGTRLTIQGDLLGTPAYMAPEQLAGAPADARTDVYAVGLLLTEMVTGRHPLRGGTPPPLPEAVAPIVARCLQIDPAARFESAAALRDALAAVPAGRRAALGAAWWWRFHQAVTACVYAALLFPAWLARRAVGGPTLAGTAGSGLFAVTLVAGIAAITLRLHLLFVSRAGTRAVERQHRHSAAWLRMADLTFAGGLVTSGLLVEDRLAALAVLLIAAGAAVAVASVVIEPATSRAAFDE
jgi:predicted Ser/Thr protein kinase